MKIELIKITIRELTDGYIDKGLDGVFGYGGLLDIRPPYQREFIYNEKQRDKVIDTIFKGFPLNVMYWSKQNSGVFEVIDGQQRTISIGKFVNGDFSVNNRYFHSLQDDEKEIILNYQIMVYCCDGSPSEKLDWFRTINISGEKLTDQELRNATFSGPWLNDAKRYFSKTNCPSYGLGSKYMKGTPIRQDYLETVIRWISNDDIENYMSYHQYDSDGSELWLYFQNVINWVKVIFPTYRKEMMGIEWGLFYNEFHHKKFVPGELEVIVQKLMMDDDVTNKKGIYLFILTGKEKHLNIRLFTESQKREQYEKQNGVCPDCNLKFDIDEMEGDHITPWSQGGKTSMDNCQMLCKEDNRRKRAI